MLKMTQQPAVPMVTFVDHEKSEVRNRFMLRIFVSRERKNSFGSCEYESKIPMHIRGDKKLHSRIYYLENNLALASEN